MKKTAPKCSLGLRNLARSRIGRSGAISKKAKHQQVVSNKIIKTAIRFLNIKIAYNRIKGKIQKYLKRNLKTVPFIMRCKMNSTKNKSSKSSKVMMYSHFNLFLKKFIKSNDICGIPKEYLIKNLFDVKNNESFTTSRDKFEEFMSNYLKNNNVEQHTKRTLGNSKKKSSGRRRPIKLLMEIRKVRKDPPLTRSQLRLSLAKGDKMKELLGGLP